MNDNQIDKIIRKRIDSGVFEDGRYSKEMHDDFIKSINEEVGIYSLSTEKTNLLMWAHYADSHKGYCIGLDYNELLKASGSIGSVLYRSKFPKLSLNPISPELDFIKLLRTKSKEWQYEKEFRIIMRHMARKTLPLPDSAIKEVILGYNMEQKFKDEIIKIVKNKSVKIRIFESTANGEKYLLDLNEI